jgi:CDP-4-dehydro-6-deoxyglucose reductase, E3
MMLQKPQQLQAVIEKKEQLTSDVFLVTFKLVTPPEISFIAGQTFMLTVDNNVKRMMSIANPPSFKNHIVLCHDTSPNGPASQWTRARKVGDTALLMAPFGMFVLDKESHRKKVLIATGTGIAPFRSMVLDYLEHGGTDDITIYWGLRHEDDIYLISDFEKISAQYPQFRLVLTLSKPSPDWKGTVGRVTDHVVQEEKNLAGTDFYLCGNHNMVKEIEAQLAERNVPKQQVHKEVFA